MKQAVMTAPGTIEMRDAPAPSPGPGEVLLRIRSIGVCGSDIHVYHGRHPYTSYPIIQGHEFSAVVEALGPQVQGIAPGMKATALPQIVCGRCKACRRGDFHICDELKVQGFQAPGCAQELFVTAADKIVPLPESFTFEQGALVEPTAVAVHAVSWAVELAGRNAVVLGGGPIGNLVAQIAQCEGARVLITDLSERRLEIARQCGLAATSNPEKESLAQAVDRVFGEDGFDVAFECVGVEATIAAAVENIDKGGRIVVVGVFGEKPRVDMGLVQDRELSIYGTLMYWRQDYERSVELIAAGRVKTEPLISKHFPLDQYVAAYRLIDRERDQVMKVFIDV